MQSVLNFLYRAPDGTCLLTCSDDNKMRLYNLPTELYSGVVDGLPEMVSQSVTGAFESLGTC